MQPSHGDCKSHSEAEMNTICKFPVLEHLQAHVIGMCSQVYSKGKLKRSEFNIR